MKIWHKYIYIWLNVSLFVFLFVCAVFYLRLYYKKKIETHFFLSSYIINYKKWLSNIRRGNPLILYYNTDRDHTFWQAPIVECSQLISATDTDRVTTDW